MIEFPTNKRCSYEIETKDDYFIGKKKEVKYKKREDERKKT